jgi:hypothetical protein
LRRGAQQFWPRRWRDPAARNLFGRAIGLPYRKE